MNGILTSCQCITVSASLFSAILVCLLAGQGDTPTDSRRTGIDRTYRSLKPANRIPAVQTGVLRPSNDPAMNPSGSTCISMASSHEDPSYRVSSSPITSCSC